MSRSGDFSRKDDQHTGRTNIVADEQIQDIRADNRHITVGEIEDCIFKVWYITIKRII